MPTKVKICGLMREADVALCAELGAHLAGFVVDYPRPVPWNLDPARAEALLACVPSPMKSCIVTGGGVEKICALAARLRPDYVQLHYRETLADTQAIARALRPLHVGVVKTLPLTDEARAMQFGAPDFDACARLLCQTEAEMLLLDSRAPETADGPGRTLDLALYRRLRALSNKPVMLAGGITAANLPAILAERPALIDIMTGVETAPGVKNPVLLAAVLQQVRDA